jgi:GNAT superfamily N-acetyltransferase
MTDNAPLTSVDASRLTLVELPQTTRVDDPLGWIYQAITDVETPGSLLEFGNTDMVFTAAERAASFSTSTERIYEAVLVDPARPRDALAHAGVDIPLAGNDRLAMLWVCVRLDARRLGLGSRLLSWAESIARTERRTSWLASLDLGPSCLAGPQVAAPQGGTIAAATPGLCFAQSRGYVLEQIERRSVLEVPLDAAWLEGLRADAAAGASGYRLHLWADGVPQRWRAGFAAMMGVFTSQAPSAGLDLEDERWDEARIVENMRISAQMGHTLLVAAVEHIESGRLVAMTELSCPDAPSEFVFQDATLVLPDHRGHRLGMWVKAANLIELDRLRPQTRRVYTWNASENEHMLAINVELGFRPAGTSVALQKKVTR